MRPMFLKIGLFIIVALVAIGFYFSSVAMMYDKKIEIEVATFKNHAQTIPNNLFGYHDLINLPEPVQRYAEYACLTGTESIKFAHLKHTGFFRTAPNQDFVPINGEEYFITEPPGFIWNGQLNMKGLPIAVRDRYWRGKGNMLVQALWSFPLVNETGKEINISSLLRYLMESVWIPTALLGDNIHWTPIDKNTAKATITDGDITGSVIFTFDEEGAIIHAITYDRYRTEGDQQVKSPWMATMRDYKTFNGFKAPTKANVSWEIDGEEFVYAKFLVTNIAYTTEEEPLP